MAAPAGLTVEATRSAQELIGAFDLGLLGDTDMTVTAPVTLALVGIACAFIHAWAQGENSDFSTALLAVSRVLGATD